MILSVEASSIGWIVFSILFCLLVSALYIFWYRDPSAGLVGPFLCVGALTSALFSSALNPIDILLVSSMKDSNGSFQPWALEPEARQSAQHGILTAYYVSYSILFLFAFFLLPFTIFFHSFDIQIPFRRRIFQSTLLSLVSLTILSVFLLLGSYLPLFSSTHIIVFLVNVMNVFGGFLLTLYTGYGCCSFSFGFLFIKSSSSSSSSSLQRSSAIQKKIHILQTQLSFLNEDLYSQTEEENKDNRLLKQGLQRQLRVLEEKRDSQIGRFSKLSCLLTPFFKLFGVLLSLLGLLIFLNLLVSSIDKGLHSDSSYVLTNGTLFNSLDELLGLTADFYPLDILLYSSLYSFLLFSTTSALQNIGIRLLFFPLAQIESRKTSGSALALLVLFLLYISLSLGSLLHTLAPNYTTHGSQRYVNNVNEVVKCDDGDTPMCVSSVYSGILSGFYSKVWFFGAVNYWSLVLFLGNILFSALLLLVRERRSRSSRRGREEGEEEEPLLNPSSIFDDSL